MKLDNLNVSCIKCIGYYVTQVANVTSLVYPRNSTDFLGFFVQHTISVGKVLLQHFLAQHLGKDFPHKAKYFSHLRCFLDKFSLREFETIGILIHITASIKCFLVFSKLQLIKN